jgi:hypothetical protein
MSIIRGEVGSSQSVFGTVYNSIDAFFNVSAIIFAA